MSLDPSYLDYPRRRHGQDIDRYDWRLAKDRPKAALPEGRELAVMPVVVCEHHPINPTKTPFNHPHGMITPFPDLRHFTTRDYGNRVGVFRILRAFREAGLTATFALSAGLLERARPLVDAVLNDGHEVAAAGLHGDAIHHSGLGENDERAMIAQVRAAFAAVDLEPKAWLSPARQQSFATPDLLAEAGFTHMLDWEIDQVPVPMQTRSGSLTALPVHNELDDFKLLIERKQTEQSWARQITEAAAFLKSEYGRFGAQILGFSLTPFVIGQPFRIGALEEALQAFAEDDRLWCAGATEIASAFAG